VVNLGVMQKESDGSIPCVQSGAGNFRKMPPMTSSRCEARLI
jgi:hypothetical protein